MHDCSTQRALFVHSPPQHSLREPLILTLIGSRKKICLYYRDLIIQISILAYSLTEILKQDNLVEFIISVARVLSESAVAHSTHSNYSIIEDQIICEILALKPKLINVLHSSLICYPALIRLRFSVVSISDRFLHICIILKRS